MLVILELIANYDEYTRDHLAKNKETTVGRKTYERASALFVMVLTK